MTTDNPSPANPEKPENRPPDPTVDLRPLSESTPVEKLLPPNPVAVWIMENLKLIGAGLAAVVLTAGVLSLYRSMQKNTLAAEADALGMILVKNVGQARLDALLAHLAKAPAELKTAITIEAAGTAFDLKKYEQAVELYDAASKSVEGVSATVIGLGKAAALSSLGKKALAAETLEAVKAKAGKGYNVVLLHEAAWLAEAQGDFDKAKSLYKELAQTVEAPMKTYYEFKVERKAKSDAPQG